MTSKTRIAKLESQITQTYPNETVQILSDEMHERSISTLKGALSKMSGASPIRIEIEKMLKEKNDEKK